MGEKTLNNKELAKYYFEVARIGSNGAETYLTYKRRITKCEIDISQFYKRNGSLENLQVDGIGEKTKSVLELILKNGFDEAVKITSELKLKDPPRYMHIQAWDGKVPRKPAAE